MSKRIYSLQWSAVENAQTYRVFRSLTEVGNKQELVLTSNRSLELNQYIPGSSDYYYFIKAQATGYQDSDYSTPLRWKTFSISRSVDTGVIETTDDSFVGEGFGYNTGFVAPGGKIFNRAVCLLTIGGIQHPEYISFLTGDKAFNIDIPAEAVTGDIVYSAVVQDEIPQLATPTIAMNADGKTLEITDVTDATSYDVYVDGTLKTNVARPAGYTVTFASNFSGEAYGGGELSDVTLTADTGASTPLTSAARGLVWQGVSTLTLSRYIANGVCYTGVSGEYQWFYETPFTLTSDITIIGASNTCLTGDTLITLADGTTKRIDTITLADKVLAYNPETMDLGADEIIRCDSDKIKIHSEYDIWTFDDGTIIKTVHRHRFYNVERSTMVYMDEWKIGEHAIKMDGTKVALVNHVNVREVVRHYTIFTKNQNYFANGLLSGNRHTKPIVFGNDGR